MKRYNLTALLFVLSAGVAVAHSGVQNAAVKARMDAMSSIGAEMKTLGLMAKGTTKFDMNAARVAAATIETHAAATPALFAAQEDDPKSEAKAAIWTNFDDFAAKAKDLETVALQLSKSIAGQNDLGPAMASLGATCKSCHSAYRE